MKFNMAAAAILNLLFCPLWSNGLFSVAASYITAKFRYLCQSAAEILLFVQKSKMAAAAILDLIFVQYFGIPACRTSSVIHMPNFVQICAIVNEL